MHSMERRLSESVTPSSAKLQLGCGHNLRVGWVNHEMIALPGVDVVHDLRQCPWPFPDQSFEQVYADNVLEHLPDTVGAMEEIYRITKPGANIFLGVPYWNSFEAWGDPTHTRVFTEETFEFFDPTTWRGRERSYYTKARFKVDRIVYCINFAKPLSRSVAAYRFGMKAESKIFKTALRVLAAYLCNVIHGLDIHLTRL